MSILKVMGASGNQNSEGLFSATDKARLDTLFALLGEEEDADEVVNTIREVLAIFDDYPEEQTILYILSLKVAIADIVDNLTTQNASKPLSANQGYVLKGLIDSINATIADYLVSVASIAPVYSSSETYSKGDMVVHEITLYRALQDIPNAEAWTAAHWESVNVVDLISEKITFGAGERDATLKVGHADSAAALDTNLGETVNKPVSFDIVGGSEDTEVATGVSGLGKISGVILTKNQLSNPANYAYETNTQNDVTATYNKTTGAITLSGTASADTTFYIFDNNQFNFRPNRKYLMLGCKGGSLSTFYLRCYFSSTEWGVDTGDGCLLIMDDHGYAANALSIVVKSGTNVDGVTFLPAVVDLTARYGSGLVVNTVIGSDPSEYVARLLAFDPSILKDLSYDAGSFQYVSAKYLVSRKYNQWNEAFTISSNTLSSEDFIRVIGGATYYFKSPKNASVTFYDANKEQIGSAESVTKNTTLSIPLKCQFIKFSIASYGSVYANDVCLSIYYDNEKLVYEKSDDDVYELPNEQLQGFLWVADNKLVIRGDFRRPNRTGANCVSSYTFTGNESWVLTNDERWDINNFSHGQLKSADGGAWMCSNGIIVVLTGSSLMAYFASNNITASTNMRALFPAGTVIKFVTSPTEVESEAFADNINVDNYGSLQILDENGNEINGLLGLEILYKANLSDFLSTVYGNASGNAGNIALKSDFDGYVKPVDESPSKITKEVNSLVYDSGSPIIVRTGRLITIMLSAYQSANSTIPADTLLFTLDSSICPPINSHFAVGVGDNVAKLRIGTDGKMTLKAGIDYLKNILIYITYAIA